MHVYVLRIVWFCVHFSILVDGICICIFLVMFADFCVGGRKVSVASAGGGGGGEGGSL